MSILSRKHITWKPVGYNNNNNNSGIVSHSLKKITWTKERPKVEPSQQVQVTYEPIPTKKPTKPHKASMLVTTKRKQSNDDFTVHFANTVDVETKEDLSHVERPVHQEEEDSMIYQTLYRGDNIMQLTEKEYLKFRVTEPFMETSIVSVPIEQQKTASVAVIGLPNAGKSTLLNRLLGNKVVAVSRKRNTTRKTHSVYVTRDEKQLLIYDTPGMIGSDDAAKVHHERAFLVAAWNAAWNADVCFVIVDCSCRIAREATKRMLIELKQRMEEQGKEFIRNILTQQEAESIQKNEVREEQIRSNNKQVWILGLNKVDHLANRQYLPDMAKEFYDTFPFAMSFMISAKKDKGIDHVRDFLFEMCRPGPWLSPLAIPYGGSFVDMMEDILREKLLHCVHFEVPYHAKFQLESCKLISSGVIAIEERMLLERKSQIGMVLGPRGSNLKWIQRAAERDLSQSWKLPVILYLNVKSESS
ncbi:GTPase Era [Galdieria sulphuraria]|nr:GTPase Era [Galdieria sulphuraria]